MPLDHVVALSCSTHTHIHTVRSSPIIKYDAKCNTKRYYVCTARPMHLLRPQDVAYSVYSMISYPLGNIVVRGNHRCHVTPSDGHVTGKLRWLEQDEETNKGGCLDAQEAPTKRHKRAKLLNRWGIVSICKLWDRVILTAGSCVAFIVRVLPEGGPAQLSISCWCSKLIVV